MDKEMIISEARSWLGTPWIHGQALKGVGTDCVQFLITLAKQFGWMPKNYKPPIYNRDWALHNEKSILIEEIQKWCDKVNSYEIGDILTFIYGKCASHAGIYIGDGNMVHAYLRRGVIETPVKYYRKYFHSAWRIKNGG